MACMIATTLVSSCAAPQGPRSAGGSEGQTQSSRPSTPKTLRMAAIREPSDGVVLFAGSGNILAQFGWMFHAGLTVYDAQSNLTPWLARKVPSVEDGDWKVLPDGSMEVTW